MEQVSDSSVDPGQPSANDASAAPQQEQDKTGQQGNQSPPPPCTKCGQPIPVNAQGQRLKPVKWRRGSGDSSMQSSLTTVFPAEDFRVQPGQWKIGQRIGQGKFGEVYVGLCEDTGQLIAIKIISLPGQTSELATLYREVDLMRSLRHPNIVSYFGAEVSEEECSLCIFQQWVPGGSVASLLKKFGPFREHVVRKYTKQLLKGLRYLHNNKIIHRDIKGANILVDVTGVVKLADFGTSKRLEISDELMQETMAHGTMKGTPYFMAPEVIMRQKYGRKADIWSLGGAVMEMATGDPPWKSLQMRNPIELFRFIHTHTHPPNIDFSLSLPLRLFLERCFIRNPKERPSAKALLKDRFVSDEWSPLMKVPAAIDLDKMQEEEALNVMKNITAYRQQSGHEDERHRGHDRKARGGDPGGGGGEGRQPRRHPPPPDGGGGGSGGGGGGRPPHPAGGGAPAYETPPENQGGGEADANIMRQNRESTQIQNHQHPPADQTGGSTAQLQHAAGGGSSCVDENGGKSNSKFKFSLFKKKPHN